MTNTIQTPASLGYRMPAEWESHEATWMSWPYNAGTWGDHLEGAEKAFAEIIAHLSAHEMVRVLVANSAARNRAISALQKKNVHHDRVHLHTIETGDVWIRDYGPTFLVKDGPNREIGWTKWIYNAYGNKYHDLLIGNEVPEQMPIDQNTCFEANIVLEGGSIDVNGSGTVLTTESCLLSPDRNPHLSKEEIESRLKDFLGVTNILWLSAGIEGDDTTGHVDDITRFTDRTTVVTVIEENEEDLNYKPLMENAYRLKKMKAEDGTPLSVVTLPMPKPFIVDGRRMAASYANFYIANKVVLVPTYADNRNDPKALAILKQCFPHHKVIGIDCRELIWGYGSIHCATQQQPT